MACGSSEGTIYLFNWNGFGATSDRFSLRAESVDCMVPITESIVCTGSLDGVIRSALGLWDAMGRALGRVQSEMSLGGGRASKASAHAGRNASSWRGGLAFPRALPLTVLRPFTFPQGREHFAQPGAGVRRAAPGGAHRAAGRGPRRAAPGQLRPRPEGEVLGHLLAGLHGGG